ncbi:MAG: hypothetical protein Kow0069_04670 [Promethearchaeota archaeon]
MPNDKVEITVVESEEITLDDTRAASLAAVKATGTWQVHNPSGKSRLWNLKLDLGNVDLTTATKTSEKKALEAGDSWTGEYELTSPKPLLKLAEAVDASKGTEHVDPFLVFGANDDARVKLLLENLADVELRNVELTKPLPSFLKLVELESCTTGEASLDREAKLFKWTVERLAPGERAEASFTGTTVVESVDPKSAEEVVVTFSAEGTILSGLNPSVEALTDTMSGVETDEGDDPGTWECEVELSNESTFTILLREVKVAHQVPTGEETVVDLKPGKSIEPDKSWSHEFVLEAPNVPKLTPSFDFTAEYATAKRVEGRVRKPATLYHVLRCEVTKTIDPPSVNAYANTELTFTDTCTNEGSAPVDSLHLEDEVPPDFELPAVEDVAVKLGESTLDSKNATVTLDGRKVVVDAKGLGESFKPGEALVVSFPVVARSPKPGVKYEAPTKITANTDPWGTEYISEVHPEVGIVYVKRKIKSLKSVSPGSEEGEFVVKIRLRNKGDVELENITVREKMPPGFRITSFQPKDLVPKEEQVGDHAELVWKIDRIEPDDDVRITYTTHGEGEYPRTEPEVVVEGGGGVSEGAGVGAAAEAAPPAAGAAKNVGLVEDAFNEAENKVKGGMLMHDVAGVIEHLRDRLQELGRVSPVMHSIGGYARDLRKQENKPCVGDKQNSVLTKIREWRAIFSE